MTPFDLIRIKLTQFIRSVLVLLGLAYRTKSPVFYVTGRFLRDNDRQNVILRGVNLPLLDDWSFPGSDKIAQVANSGANAIRLQWYAAYPNPTRPAYGVGDLDGILDKCRLNRMIPIVELHDLTCKSDPALLASQLMPWWTRADVVAVLKRHQRYLIINLANEFGVYRWQESSPAALTAFKNAYKAAITAIRGQGLLMPIMIDAPDCGTSLNAFLQIGQELIAHDPRHSILLSAHAYWAGDYDGTADVALAVNAGLPIVFGEIANKQEDNGNQCHYALDGTGVDNPPPSGFQYQNLLAQLTQVQVGWLAWAWYKDACAARCITPDGNYAGAGSAGLTPYGNDILNNATYGLLAVPPKRTASLPGAAPFP